MHCCFYTQHDLMEDFNGVKYTKKNTKFNRINREMNSKEIAITIFR